MNPDSSRTVLLVDNDPSALEMVRFGLRRRGYGVITADSRDSALEAIREQIFHVAIIDLRLENEKFVQDTSGFSVAQALPENVPFIIYTAYEQKNTIKEALGRLNASASIDKTEGRAASRLLEHIDALFADAVSANFELSIEGESTPEWIASQLQLRKSAEHPQPDAADIRMVVRQLFLDARMVHLSPLLDPEDAPTLSQSGSIVLRVEAETKHGVTAPAVLKICAREDIEREDKNSKRIEPYIGGSRSSVSGKAAYSRGVGGLMFTFVGAAGWDSMRSLAEVIRDEPTANITALLWDFLPVSFGNLYRAAKVEKKDLAKHYSEALNLSVPKLLESARTFGVNPARSSEAIEVDGLGRSMENPLYWLLDGESIKPFPAQSPWSLCHGDLHSRNVLVDSEDHFWLVDFERVQRCHAFQDLAELECDIKFYVMSQCEIRKWDLMERALLTPNGVEDELPTLVFGEELDHIYAVIATLRSTLFDMVVPKLDMREYYYALLWHALKMWRLNHVSEQQKWRAFLSASLIVERIRDWSNWDPPTQRDVNPLPFWLPTTASLRKLFLRQST